MLNWLFCSSRRRRASVAAPDPAAVAARIHALVALPPDQLRDIGLPPEETDLLRGAVTRLRGWLALNVLLFWALRDIAGFDVFRAFYRLAFNDTDAGTAGIDALRERARSRLATAPGMVFFQSIQSDPDRQRALDAVADFSGLFDRVVAVMAQDFGVPERATRSGFDEDGYLDANPDVAAAVIEGREHSALAHFTQSGEAEGRWQRRRGPDRHADFDFAFPIDLVRVGVCHSPFGVERASRIVPLRGLPAARGEGIAVSLVGQGEAHDARPSLDLTLSPETDIAACRALDAATVWESRPPYVAALDDACIDVDNGIVFLGRDRLWSDSCYATLLTHGGPVRSRDIFELAGRFARISAAAEVSDLLRYVALLCCTWATRVNHGHWLMNTLFSIYLLREPVVGGSLPLLCPRLSDEQRGHLTALGVPADNILESDTRYVRCGRLLYPSPLTTNANLFPHSETRAFVAWLRDRLPMGSGPMPERLYLSRVGFPSGRRMVNEPALEARLREEFGFAIVRPHELPLHEQIHVMSRAKIIVGQFGAALWNTAFAPAGAVLVEISSSNYATNEYLYLSHLMSHRFIRVMTHKEGTAYDGASFSFACPIDTIAAILRGLP